MAVGAPTKIIFIMFVQKFKFILMKMHNCCQLLLLAQICTKSLQTSLGELTALPQTT